ncbi:MAG: hypothetical protein IJ733_03770, partial [Lachnospiraceae bacterium]|nr:hypothetical protein [Lachnospiraceae bacterium]
MQYKKVIELFANYAYLKQVIEQMRCQTYTMPVGYTDYLSNSKQFREIFEKNALLPGKKTLLVAGCGAGKTKYALSELARALLGRRQVVLAVPTSLQATQNGNTYSFI